MTSTSQVQLPIRRRTPSRRLGMAMAAEAVTFMLASAIHFGTGFTQAAIPELVIAGVAVGTTAFATFGTTVGLAIIASGRQDLPDLIYHATILAALAVTLTGLARMRR
jgi:hypothetical protein